MCEMVSDVVENSKKIFISDSITVHMQAAIIFHSFLPQWKIKKGSVFMNNVFPLMLPEARNSRDYV